MHRVVLINLSPDAHQVQARSQRTLDVTDRELLALLWHFAAIDPIENATAETELRIQRGNDNFLVRAADDQLLLYDMNQRALPGQKLMPPQVLAEIDGSAAVARERAVDQARLDAAQAETTNAPRRSRRPLLLACLVPLLVVALAYLTPPGDRRIPDDFRPTPAAEKAALLRRFTGVYLTGSEPGHHGIVVDGAGGMKLIELGTIDAPRTVTAAFQFGLIKDRLHLATDQPGGLIEVADDQTLLYCGEKYRRIP